ncbi:MAG TPA: heterodisulfide reductase-related iron-sulfur binding cluster [Chloroflexota bacterium]|nr:heterodisulfide reductase-related iron-sulfur binding cluster [Chloroflexota bacterium]
MADDSHIPAQARAAAQSGGARRPADTVQEVGVASEGVAAGAVAAPRGGFSILPAFDEHHPPSFQLVEECVHCGFCLPSCPTYLLFGEEMDSPRGRIYLMKEALQGEPLDGAMARHFDLCLGCLACVTACPSGVRYERLIEATRQQVERRYRRSVADRSFRALIYQLFPYPARLRLFTAPLGLYQRSGLQSLVRRSGVPARFPSRLRSLEELMPPLSPRRDTGVPVWTPALGSERRRVGLLLGCVQRFFFGEVNAATARVLSAEGCGVLAPQRQGCCGALSLHAGREAEAMRFARKTIDCFEAAGVETVAVNVAGCGSAMKEYGYLLRDDPQYAERARQFSARVRDVSELLSELGPVAERHALPLTVVYHDACHLAHGQGIRAQPRELLRQIPGLTLHEVPREREICCGSAGTYNLLEPEPARELGERKARAVLDAGAQLLVTGNPGCHLQIQAALRRLHRPLPAAHVMEVIDASIRGVPVDALVQWPAASRRLAWPGAGA